jgi:hypothetical protein
MSGPALVIVAGIVTTAIAFAGADGLVADDYYKQGVTINRTLARDALARRMQVEGTLRFRDGEVVANLGAREPLPGRLRLTIAHVTREARDQVVFLALGADGLYRAPLAPLAPGRWSVIVETDRWRIAELADLRDAREVRLAAGSLH